MGRLIPHDISISLDKNAAFTIARKRDRLYEKESAFLSSKEKKKKKRNALVSSRVLFFLIERRDSIESTRCETFSKFFFSWNLLDRCLCKSRDIFMNEEMKHKWIHSFKRYFNRYSFGCIFLNENCPPPVNDFLECY